MNLGTIMFIDSYPKLDLHGYDRETASIAVNDFIRDSKKMKNEIVVIVHGIGSGIVKESVYQTLKKNKSVIDYKTSYYNNGCTLVRIKFDKKKV